MYMYLMFTKMFHGDHFETTYIEEFKFRRFPSTNTVFVREVNSVCKDVRKALRRKRSESLTGVWQLTLVVHDEEEEGACTK